MGNGNRPTAEFRREAVRIGQRQRAGRGQVPDKIGGHRLTCHWSFIQPGPESGDQISLYECRPSHCNSLANRSALAALRCGSDAMNRATSKSGWV